MKGADVNNQLALTDDAQIIAATVQWLERAVIGLNLCPFAKGVHVKDQIHYVVCHATSDAQLLDLLAAELRELHQCDANVRDTTLLIVPARFDEFLVFNDLLGQADKVLQRLGLEGILQIASFHPHYQFAGVDADDISNFTNRAPYPTLHLLREQSIDRAVEAFPQAEQIFEKNMLTLQDLGPRGWNALGLAVRACESNAGQTHEKN